MLEHIHIPAVIMGMLFTICLGVGGYSKETGYVEVPTRWAHESGASDRVTTETFVCEAEPAVKLTDEEIKMMATLVMAEAGGEGEAGIRMVIDVILNRMDDPRFPNTVRGVIYAQNQFAPMRNGAFEKCYPREDICQLIEDELIERTNSEVLYFRTKHFHTFGTPLFKLGNHYFSK